MNFLIYSRTCILTNKTPQKLTIRVNTQLAKEPNKRMLGFNNEFIAQLSSLIHHDSNILLKNVKSLSKNKFFDQVRK